VTKWRYIAQRATTGQFLDFEVPFLTRSELTWSLSAAGSLKGTVSPETGALQAMDGRPLFEEWNTIIYAEADGQIRWGGLVVSSEASGSDWDIEAATFATYPSGMPYLGEFYGAEQDVADVIREIWEHLQSFDTGNLGVQVTGTTGVKVGSKSEAAANAATAAYNAAKAVYTTERDAYTALRAIATDRSHDRSDAIKARTAANATLSDKKTALAAAKRSKDPAAIAAASAAADAAQTVANAATNLVNATDAIYQGADANADAQAKVRDAAKAKQDAASAAKKKALAAMKDDGGAYKLLWWEAPDCGSKIADLVASTPVDYVETHAWTADKTAITHTIDIQYPRAGRRRDDLAFILGDNITVTPTAKSNGDDYANSIFGLGNGEGEAMIHTTSAINDGRLRRVNVMTKKDTKQLSLLQAQARTTLLQSISSLTIDQIVVRDHPNAVIGSWALGDDIYVQADIPWVGRIGIWHRIVSWSLTSDSSATLKLERSDSFTYGK
jgi:hypothetical protein